MIQIKASNSTALADCLGGYLSLQDFPIWRPVVDLDTMRCLFIDSFRLSGTLDITRAEFTITKVVDDFTLSISYPTAAGWVTLADIEFTLSVGDTYQSTDELACITIRRILTGLDGTMTGRVTIPYNTPLGGDNVDADDTVTRYGCLFFVLADATYIEEITSYGIVEGVDTDAACQIAFDTPGILIQGIVNDETAPTGLTWANTISMGYEVPAGTYGLWYKTISSGAVGEITYVIKVDQAAGGNSESIIISGRHRRYDNTIEPYVVYGAYDGSTIEGTYINEFSSFPADIILELPVTGTRNYLLRVVEQSRYGVESQNVLLDQAVSITDAGADATVPQTPSSLALTFRGIGYPSLSFNYVFDTKEQVIFAQIEIDDVVVKNMPITGAGAYAYRAIDPVLWGESVTARVRFLDRYGRTGAWASVTASCTASPAHQPLYAIGGSGGLAAAPIEPFPYYRFDYNVLATLVSEPGRVSFYYDGVLEFYAWWNASDELELFLGDWRRKNEAVSGAQTQVIEDVSGMVYISDGTTRRIKLDVANKLFCANQFKQPITKCRRAETMPVVDGVTYFQAFPTSLNNQKPPEPWIALEGEAVYMCKFKQTT